MGVSLTIMLCSLPVLASPIIQFEKVEVNVGEVQSGQIVQVEFPFKNMGDQPLEIKSVSASCGCTQPKAKQNILQPGESSAIEAKFTVPMTGADFNKPIAVMCNDPANREVKLSIVGKAIQVVTLTPASISIETMMTGSRREETVLVTPTNPDGFSIDSVIPSGKHLIVREVVKANDGKGSYRIKFTITAGGIPGRVLDYLLIKLGLPNKPEVRVLVYGNVEAKKDDSKPA